jgi:hypothetical protein
VRAAFRGVPERPREEFADDEGYDDEDGPPPEEGIRRGGDAEDR